MKNFFKSVAASLAIAGAVCFVMSCNADVADLLDSVTGGSNAVERVVNFNSNGATKAASPKSIKTVPVQVDIVEEVVDPEDPEAEPTIKVSKVTEYVINSLPKDPERANYVFNGWNTEPNGSGSVFTTGMNVGKKTLTVYAQWVEERDNQMSFTGGIDEKRLTVPGYYMVELWGGQGWSPVSNSEIGGKGAYVRGVFEVTEEDIAGPNFSSIYISVAGRGEGGTQTYGGAGFNKSGMNEGAGGGASDMRWGGQTIYDRVLVAGGGGGGNDRTKTGESNVPANSFWKGGFAGGLSDASDGEGDDRGRGAKLAGQAGAGGQLSVIDATFFWGGTYNGVNESAGGGGGGYFGGSAGGQQNTNGGGGGGTSYISGFPGFTAITGPDTNYPDEEGFDRMNSSTNQAKNITVGLKTGAETDGATEDYIEIIKFEEILANPDLPFDEETNVVVNTFAHKIRVKNGTSPKATHYSGKKFIPELRLFVGEEDLEGNSLEKVYTSAVYDGSQSMPKPTGEMETGHSGLGYARITYLGDGVIHELYEPVTVEDEDNEEEVEAIE